MLHEPGTKTVLGARYGEAGVEEGERVIRGALPPPLDGAVHRDEARHAFRGRRTACRRRSIAWRETFRDTDGDLRAVASALVDLPEAWDERTRKFRTPQDWLIAVLRAFNATEVNEAVMPLLRQLRHPLWSPQAPKGFGDTMQEWADPDSLLNRAELARTLARRLRARRVDPRGSARGRRYAARAIRCTAFLADNSIPADERIALALAGPAFQWR